MKQVVGPLHLQLVKSVHPSQGPFLSIDTCLGGRLTLPFSGITWRLSLVKKNVTVILVFQELKALQTGIVYLERPTAAHAISNTL